MMAGKKEYFAVYAYGQGGIWFVISARSLGEIETKFPFLKVFEQKPAFDIGPMPEEFHIDINEPEGELLAQIRKETVGLGETERTEETVYCYLSGDSWGD